jgi:hypothetical protein
MIQLKDSRILEHSAFFVCRVLECTKESSKIWSNKEINIIDVCDEHYLQLQQEREI